MAREWRYEGLLAAGVAGAVAGRPLAAGVLVRASTEPDYESRSAGIRASAELLDRNLTLSLQLGYGRDTVVPVAAPAGQDAEWPAHHRRVSGVLAATQLLSPRVVLSGSLGATFQRGQLASPYRNAIVNTTLYPEAVPDARDRVTAFLGVSVHMGEGTAFHLRQGAYADTWDVRALVPEATLASEIEDGVLGVVRYRLYRQWPASFYEAVYGERLPVMTGDLRLGSLLEHAGALELGWRLLGASAAQGSTVSAFASYELSVLDYRSLGTRVVAHVFGVGLGGAY